MRLSNRFAMSAIAAILGFSLPRHCAAQSAPALPAHNFVAIVHVKPDMLTEWIDLQKNEVIPAQKKGGLSSRTTYQTVRGNPFEYVTVIPFDKYATFDDPNPMVKALGAEGSARLGAKLRKCIESVQTFTSNSLPELSN